MKCAELKFVFGIDQYIQLERRGYFKVDKIHEENGQKVPELIFIPDGKSKGMSTITKNVTLFLIKMVKSHLITCIMSRLLTNDHRLLIGYIRIIVEFILAYQHRINSFKLSNILYFT